MLSITCTFRLALPTANHPIPKDKAVIFHIANIYFIWHLYAHTIKCLNTSVSLLYYSPSIAEGKFQKSRVPFIQAESSWRKFQKSQATVFQTDKAVAYMEAFAGDLTSESSWQLDPNVLDIQK